VLSVRSEILHLNPKPGAAFSGGAVKFVIPDIVVRKIDDEIVIMMNDTAFPKVRWNSFYRTLLSSSGDDDAKKYLHEKLQKAKILLQNIEQRRSTVLKVMENVVNKQAGFFEEGDFSINPLTLKEVAADLGVHESTVSRAISNKYVDTPYGVYPCKMFFSPRIQSEGEDISQHSVKRIIQDIIDDEDKRNPLSDQDIVQHLERLGVKVARRTVAKYRGLLGIPSSAKRKAITNL
jgi:RNA polymerase sigma-54 factor